MYASQITNEEMAEVLAFLGDHNNHKAISDAVDRIAEGKGPGRGKAAHLAYSSVKVAYGLPA